MPRGGGHLLWGNGAPLNTLEWIAHVFSRFLTTAPSMAFQPIIKPSFLFVSPLFWFAHRYAGWALGPAVHLALIWGPSIDHAFNGHAAADYAGTC